MILYLVVLTVPFSPFQIMNLLWCCFVAAFTMANTAPVNVESTVRQVQTILRENPQLPRLSRDDIIKLLDDIRAEDARNSKEFSPPAPVETENLEEQETADKLEGEEIREIAQLEQAEIEVQDNEIPYHKPGYFDDEVNATVETTTKSNEASVMVVLPYTPRDGSSLQELYTKAPRTKLVPASRLTTETTEKMTASSSEIMLETFELNAKLANEARKQISSDLEDFLRTHDLAGGPGNDHFLLPLEGFKPLPSANVVDDNVELPENIILTYDLASSKPSKNDELSPSRVPYDPLQPEYPFELATAESENKNVALPLDLPIKPYKGLDLQSDQISVLPLKGGLNPANDDSFNSGSEVGKRQTEAPNEPDDADSKEPTTVAPAEVTVKEDVKTESNNSTSNRNSEPAPQMTDNFEPSAADTGASISDLEDSFGGAAPSEPGDAQLPPPKKNGFYWMLDWNSFLEVGDGDTKVNIRFEPKLGDPQMFLPVSVP